MRYPVVKTFEEADEYLKRGCGVGVDLTGRKPRNIGDKVYLRYNCGYGSLNGMTLWEHGHVTDKVAVEIVGFGGSYEYMVRLPDGYLLSIDERDIRAS